MEKTNVPSPDQVTASLQGHAHVHYEVKKGELVDLTSLTPAELLEVDCPDVRLTQEQAVAFNALKSASRHYYDEGAAHDPDKRAAHAAAAQAAFQIVMDFICEVRP